MSYTLFHSSLPIVKGAETKLFLIDVDGTLITSKTGRRWATNANDWIFLGSPRILNRLKTEGWTVALITNQSEWKLSPDPEAKIASVLAALQTANGWRPWCLVATATRKEKDTVYRKPARGLYDVLVTHLEGPVGTVHMCGDAVSISDPFPPYRWSDSDAAFAAAIGASFIRPTELFIPSPPVVPSSSQELMLLMGPPGSGKSTTGRMLAAAGYIHVEQDTVGTKAAVARAARDALATGKSVVIDATHGSDVNREPYIKLANEKGIPLRIAWHIRDGRPFNALREKPVPEVAYAVYSKHFVAPTGHVLICG